MSKNRYLQLIVLILILLLAFTCNPGKIIDMFKNEPRIDTVITVKSDTIWPDTVFKNIFVDVPGPSTTYTVYSSVNSQGDSMPSFVNIYADTLRDSNIVISYKDSIEGRLLGKELNYKLLVPLKIIDSIFVNIHEVEAYKPKNMLFIGAKAQIYPLEPHLGPVLTFKNKRDRLFHADYDLFSGAVSVGFSTKLQNPLRKRTNP